jgi:hypothetical protein
MPRAPGVRLNLSPFNRYSLKSIRGGGYVFAFLFLLFRTRVTAISYQLAGCITAGAGIG